MLIKINSKEKSQIFIKFFTLQTDIPFCYIKCSVNDIYSLLKRCFMCLYIFYIGVSFSNVLVMIFQATKKIFIVKNIILFPFLANV